MKHNDKDMLEQLDSSFAPKKKRIKMLLSNRRYVSKPRAFRMRE